MTTTVGTIISSSVNNKEDGGIDIMFDVGDDQNDGDVVNITREEAQKSQQQQHYHHQQQQQHQRVPWQMEWKHPQWIAETSATTKDGYDDKTDDDRSIANNDDAVIVVGLTTAHLSSQEISKILQFDINNNSGSSSSSAEDNNNNNNNFITRIDQDCDRHYLLSVSMLGSSSSSSSSLSRNDSTSKEDNGEEKIEKENNINKLLASEVLVEVLDVPKSDNNNNNSNNNDDIGSSCSITTTKVLCSKRLRWPESIFNNIKNNNNNEENKEGGGSGSGSGDVATNNNEKKKKKKKQKKNLLTSIFLPLMGIHEEDEYEVRNDDENKKGTGDHAVVGDDGKEEVVINTNTNATTGQVVSGDSTAASTTPIKIGIVSATLCRRPVAEDQAVTTATNDIVELMSFGGGGGGGMGTTTTTTTTTAVDKKGHHHHDNELATSTTTPSSREDTTAVTTVQQIGELSFVCVSQAGEVFVYDPIKLLLGIEDESGLDQEEKDAKKDLEDVSSFFFGQQLFQNLQEKWKPLAEPSSRIHLSIFEHDNNNNNNNVHHQQQDNNNSTIIDPLSNLIKTNEELSDWAKSVMSGNTSSKNSKKKKKRKNQTRRRRLDSGSRSSVGSGNISSVGTGNDHSSSGWERSYDGSHDDHDEDDTSTVATGASEAAFSLVANLASELQTNVDETISMLPYLFNPLLEPSTIKDRTKNNKPLEISVAGNSFIVVTGSGIRSIGKSSKHSRGGITNGRSGASASSRSTTTTRSRGHSKNKNNRHPQTKKDDTISSVASSNSSIVSSSIKGTTKTTIITSTTNDNEEGSQLSSEQQQHGKKKNDIPTKNPSTEEEDDDAPNENKNPFSDDDDDNDNEVNDAIPKNPFDDDDDVDKDEVVDDDKPTSSSMGAIPKNPFDEDDNEDNELVVDKTQSSPPASSSSDDKKPFVEDDEDEDDHVERNEESKSALESSWWDEPSDKAAVTTTSTKTENDDKENIVNTSDENNSQRHYFDGYDNDDDDNDDDDEDDDDNRGGFVTFLSTARWSETRTLFLPFVPVKVSHIAKWNGMELLWIIGQYKTLLIRMDSNNGPVAVPIGGGDVRTRTTGNDETDLFRTATGSNITTFTGHTIANEPSTLLVNKFQILPIELGVSGSIPPKLLCASDTGIDPPSLLELYIDPNPIDDNNIATTHPQQHPHHYHSLVLLKTLDYCTSHGTVVLHHAPSHVAKIAIVQDNERSSSRGSRNDDDLRHVEQESWAQHDQGWSLFGNNRRTYFICWEGSTLLQGAYVKELERSPNLPPSRYSACTTHVLPLCSTGVMLSTESSQYRSSQLMSDVGIQPGTIMHEGREQQQVFVDPRQSSSAIVQLPVIKELERFSLMKNINEEGGDDEYGVLSSAKAFGERNSGTYLSGTRSSTISSSFSCLRRRNSERLLQQCSSWTQLEDNMDDRAVLERQEPVLCLRRGAVDSPHYMLSLRQLVVDNGVASPFQQVLAWLAKRKNFFAATGIALDLLQDADTLFYLWKHAEMINEEDEEMKLIGLLDGIIPVRFLDENGTSTPCERSVTAVHLSEMTVGCFIKGGAAMSKSLIQFLEKNKSYDPSRVSLMLAFATVNEIVDDQESEETAQREKHQDMYFDELLWPIKCLLAVGTTRDYLLEAFALLNSTIPDELRHRLHHHGDDGRDEEEEEEKISSSESTPSMKLTKKLVELIVESDPVAIDILMSFVDDRSQGHYWQSLDHETRLNLSLMKADSHFPFLRHPEVRTWARGQLDLCFKEDTKSVLPTSWLQELCVACLHNADCELKNLEIVDDNNIDEHLLLSSTLSDMSEKTYVTGSVVNTGIATTDLGRSMNSGMDDNDGIYKLKFEIEKTRNALLPPTDDSYSLDYDLLVPALLLLQYRNAHWHPSSSSSLSMYYISTQPLLDAACYQAGRTTTPVSICGEGGGGRIAAHHRTAILTSRIMRNRTDDEPFLFAAFDNKSAMKQCFQANNIVAGANLIGGTNGFILQVCYILTEGLGISVNDAESFLLNDVLDLQIVEESKMEMVSFELTSRHRILLLLLDEHVLSIKTFGDFDSIHNRGRVDPVFAARSILRAWLSLSYGDKSNSSNWLGDWLARRLEIRSDVASSSSTSPNTTRIFVDEHEDTIASAGSNNNNKHQLACASLARSLLWPNNNATPKTASATTVDNDDDSKENGGDGSTIVPLAISMKFEKKLLIQLCQSCLGLVESVPPNAMEGINV